MYERNVYMQERLEALKHLGAQAQASYNTEFGSLEKTVMSLSDLSYFPNTSFNFMKLDDNADIKNLT
jgi:hypothetical protein